MNDLEISIIILVIVFVLAAIGYGIYRATRKKTTTTKPNKNTTLTPTVAPTTNPNTVTSASLTTPLLLAPTVASQVAAISAVTPAPITPVPVTTPPQINGRFVKISNPVVGCMNLAELQVFSVPQGANLAAGKPVTKSSGYPPGADTLPGNLLTDGDYTTYAHTGCTEAPWMMVDLGVAVPIYSVVVYNRTDNNCGTRTTGSIVTILDPTYNTVYTSSPFPDKMGNITMDNSCGDNVLQPYASYYVLPPSPVVNGR